MTCTAFIFYLVSDLFRLVISCFSLKVTSKRATAKSERRQHPSHRCIRAIPFLPPSLSPSVPISYCTAFVRDLSLRSVSPFRDASTVPFFALCPLGPPRQLGRRRVCFASPSISPPGSTAANLAFAVPPGRGEVRGPSVNAIPVTSSVSPPANRVASPAAARGSYGPERHPLVYPGALPAHQPFPAFAATPPSPPQDLLAGRWALSPLSPALGTQISDISLQRAFLRYKELQFVNELTFSAMCPSQGPQAPD